MHHPARLILLCLTLVLALPAVARASTVDITGGVLTFTGGAAVNTAVVVKQPTPNTYFIADQTAGPPTTSTLGCTHVTVPADGVLCTLVPVSSIVENLGGGNDTGIVSSSGGPPGTINGEGGDDTLVGAQESDTFSGGPGTDSVAYVGITDSNANLTRTAPITAALPTAPVTQTASNGEAGENDTIKNDVEGLIGGNSTSADHLTGNGGPNTIAAAAPPGTPDVVTSPAGPDVIVGGAGDDQLLAGDTGSVSGGTGNDTIVGGRSTAGTTIIHGNENDDTIVSGLGRDSIFGDAGSDTLAYGTVSQGGLQIVNRTTGVTATLPNTGLTATGGGAGEGDTIHGDIETLVGSNQSDVLKGSNRADTIVGAAPVGTPGGIKTAPAGNDTIDGAAGADTLVAGDSGSVNGDSGADQIVGGRSRTATTVIHGGDDNDTIVSGLGDDDIFGDGGANTLAYASVSQGGIKIVDRGTNGVTANLAPTATTPGSGGQTNSAEHDTLHSGINTLVGSNGNDQLTGGPGNDQIVGVAPAGTPGVVPGPAGNDVLNGGAGVDLLLGGAGNDRLNGGPGPDVFAAGAGNDVLISLDGLPEAPSCGAGADSVIADSIDKPAADCERVATDKKPASVPSNPTTAAKDKTKPVLRERSAILRLGKGRKVTLYLSCRNEKKGCKGTFTIKTRSKIKVGKHKAKRYTLGKLTFKIAGNKPKKFRVTLSKTTLKLVKRHHSIRLTGTASTKDSSANKATKTFKLRLKRP